MRHVRLFQYDDAASSIEYLDGRMIATRPGRIIDLNDVNSFAIRVREARVIVPATTMAALMNRQVLPTARSGISNTRISFSRGKILLKGSIRKAGLPLGFSATALPEVTPEGDFRLRIVRLKAIGIFSKKFLDGLGFGMPALIKSHNFSVLRVERDTMTVPVAAMFPAPVLSGKLSVVQINNRGLIATIGHGTSTLRSRAGDGPVITLAGGAIRFAHIVMPEARLKIMPEHREAEFAFSPKHYYEQMVEGHSKATPDYGLIGYFADFHRH